MTSATFSSGPCVSVIIPTFNNGRFLPRTLESICQQTWQNIEVLLIDDGSTDNTADLLPTEWPATVRFHYLRQTNQGVCAARNAGLRLAQGEFILFLDGDDLLLPTKLADQVAFLQTHPKVGAVHSGWHLVNAQDEQTGLVEPWHTAPKLDLLTWLLWKPVFLGAMLFRQVWLRRVEPFDTTLRQAEDTDLLWRLSLAGCQMAWLKQPTVCYRQHGSSTTQNGRQQAKDLTAVLDKFFAAPRLPWQVRLLEKRVRYYTTLWLVWQLHRTGYTADIPAYLRQTLPYVSRPLPQLVADWQAQLAAHASRDGVEVTVLRELWPCFETAVSLPASQWHTLQQTLAWWLDVWRHYLVGQPTQANWQPYTTANLLPVISQAIIANPTAVSTSAIQQVCHDMMQRGLLPPPAHNELTSLYLTLFGQAVLGRHWRLAAQAAAATVQMGIRPLAWKQFLQNSLRYLYQEVQLFRKS